MTGDTMAIRKRHKDPTDVRVHQIGSGGVFGDYPLTSREGKEKKKQEAKAKLGIICKEEGCKVPLSRYNPGEYCGKHEEYFGTFVQMNSKDTAKYGQRNPSSWRVGKW